MLEGIIAVIILGAMIFCANDLSRKHNKRGDNEAKNKILDNKKSMEKEKDYEIRY